VPTPREEEANAEKGTCLFTCVILWAIATTRKLAGIEPISALSGLLSVGKYANSIPKLKGSKSTSHSATTISWPTNERKEMTAIPNLTADYSCSLVAIPIFSFYFAPSLHHTRAWILTNKPIRALENQDQT
jgi:hypothetical protein